MKLIRKLHLYLGCFFAPLLIFFVASGTWQTFVLHRSKKDGSYIAPAILQRLSEVHIRQRLRTEKHPGDTSIPFRIFILFMSVGIVSAASLGIVLAVRFARNRFIIWGVLAGGVIVPILVLVV